MRARLILNILQIPFKTIEIDLKNKPKEFLDISPKGTVPVLVLEDGTIIDESLDIVSWAIKEYPGTVSNASYNFNLWLSKFIPKLNRYKYPDRYKDVTGNEITECNNLLLELDLKLENHKFLDGNEVSESDIAIFPFVRQFMKVNKDVFSSLDTPFLHDWFEYFINSSAFIKSMEKS